jgi:hypothetical protein
MSDIQRYSVELDVGTCPTVVANKDDSGYWVYHKDHLKAIEAKEAELAEKDRVIEQLKEGLKEALEWNWLDDDYPDQIRKNLEDLL